MSEAQARDLATIPLEKLEPPRGSALAGLRHLYQYRELLFHLTLRDIKIRYKQAVLGLAWAILRPLILMVIFTIIFSELAGISSGDIPYPVFSYAALLPWTLFNDGVKMASGSLVTNVSLVQNIYFPREVLPASGILACVFDFAIAFTILVGICVWYGYYPSLAWLMLPLLLGLLLLFSLGLGLLLAALNVSYRDVKYAVPLALQVWMYLTPIIYPLELIPDRFQLLYQLNPMVGIIEGFRGIVVHGRLPDPGVLAVGGASSVVIFILCYRYFKRVERKFADVI